MLGAAEILTDVVESPAEYEGRLRAFTQRVRQAQERIAKYVPAGTSLVDKLIAERRFEAEREASE